MKKGFSIIEMILYAGLLVLFLGVLSNLFLSSLDIKTESEATSYLGQDARLVLSRLNYDIKRADSITAPALGTSSTSLILNIDGVSYTYALSGEKIVLTNNLGSANLNGSETGVAKINFERIGNVGGKNSIKMSFTMDGKDYSTTVAIR